MVGAAIVATRFVIDQTHPASLALLRYLIGFFCLLPLLLLTQKARIRFERRDLLPIAVLGITQFGIVVALLNVALQMIPSARAALLFATFPLLTLLIAALFGLERITLYKSAGVLLTILGVGFALGTDAVRPGMPLASVWLGDLAALASALSGAACSVFYRPYLRKYPTLSISAFAMLASVFFLAGLAALEGFFTGWPQFTWRGWCAVGFIGISSGVGYYLWLWALNHTTPTKVTIFLALSPLTAAILGLIWLGEPVSVPVLTALGCVAAGLWLAYRPNTRIS